MSLGGFMSALSYAQSINPSKSVCHFANTDVHFQLLVPKILTRFYNLLILTYEHLGGLGFAGFQGIVWWSRAWMDICHNQSPACKPNSRENAWCYFFYAWHSVFCIVFLKLGEMDITGVIQDWSHSPEFTEVSFVVWLLDIMPGPQSLMLHGTSIHICN